MRVSWSTVSPAPAAAACMAPGRRSPSCWRSSSMLTFPFDTICPSAIMAPSVSAALLPSFAMAPATDSNTALPFSPSRAVSLMLASQEA